MSRTYLDQGEVWIGQTGSDPVWMLDHFFDGIFFLLSLLRIGKNALNVLSVDADVDLDDLLWVVLKLAVVAEDVRAPAGDANAVPGSQHVTVVDEGAATRFVIFLIILKREIINSHLSSIYASLLAALRF